MAATLGRRVHPQRGGETLRSRGWTSKVPRPRHAKADPTAQMALKKPPDCSARLTASVPQQGVELWATDHHRIGLTPPAARLEPARAAPGGGCATSLLVVLPLRLCTAMDRSNLVAI